MLHKRTVTLLLLLILSTTFVLCADLYSILEVSRNANEKQIKKAYNKLAKKYHPDRNKDNPQAQKRFIEISKAYDV